MSRARALDLPIADLRELERLWDDDECAGAGRATARESLPDGVSVLFPSDPALAAGPAELATNEQRCCSFFTFRLSISSDGVRLGVTARPSAATVLTDLFGAPGPA